MPQRYTQHAYPRTRRDHRGRPVWGGTVTLASATLITKKQIRASTRPQDWQHEAWAFFDSIGELHFATRWQGNAASRAHLFIGSPQPEGGGDPEPADAPPDLAVQLLRELHHGQVGQGEMLRRIAMHLTVSGESYLVGMDPLPEDGPDAGRRWIVASNDEFTHSGSRSRVRLPDTGESVDLDPATSTCIRLWNPHPRLAWEADSSIRANLPALREVQSMTSHIKAVAESRLAGPGLLIAPHSASMSRPGQSESDGTAPLHEDPFMDAMTQAMLTAIQDPDDASALVPLIARVPDESVNGFKHLPFWSELDEKAMAIREAALRRFAAGADLPAEVLTGMSDANHWGAWQIDEAATKMHTEPLLAVICDALTQQYLWPALRAARYPDPERFVIWFDTAELTQRPDKSAEAQALFDKGVLSKKALLRENGFNPDDVVTEDERRRELARQFVLAAPEVLPAFANILGFPELSAKLGETIQVPSERGAQEPAGELESSSRGTNAPSGSSRNNPPTRPNSTVASASIDPWILAAAEQAAIHALGLAGKKLYNKQPRSIRASVSPKGVAGYPKDRQIPAWNLHTKFRAEADEIDKLLEGAYEPLRAAVDSPCVETVVDTYCRAKLASQKEHDPNDLAEVFMYANCFMDDAIAS